MMSTTEITVICGHAPVDITSSSRCSCIGFHSNAAAAHSSSALWPCPIKSHPDRGPSLAPELFRAPVAPKAHLPPPAAPHPLPTAPARRTPARIHDSEWPPAKALPDWPFAGQAPHGPPAGALAWQRPDSKSAPPVAAVL